MSNPLNRRRTWAGDGVPIIAIVGRTNSGKTTLIEHLMPVLAYRGHRVATIKRHRHGDFETDRPGKDSWRHMQAGSVATALVGTSQLAIFQRPDGEVPPHLILRLFAIRPDVVLAEGYTDSLLPKVEIVRTSLNRGPLCGKEDRLVALVTDGDWDLGVPRFGLEDTESLGRWLIEQFLSGAPWASGSAECAARSVRVDAESGHPVDMGGIEVPLRRPGA